MKNRVDNIFNEIIDFENMRKAFYNTQKGSNKFKTKSLRFESNLTKNLIALQKELKSKKYTPSNYNSFYVYEPKKRLIYSPTFRDKIVHHSINNVLKEIYNNCFINTTYACIDGRGVYNALNQLKHYISISNRDSWVIKLDIKKFFYSIDHNILKRIIKKKIKCKDTLELLFKIIDSSPINPGLPLGNLTSQLFANIYMNEIDQYCKRKLKLKKYIRYMDDIIILVDNKCNAKVLFSNIKQYINSLNLTLNKKSHIFPLSQGINTLGVKISKDYCLLRKSIVKTMKKLIKNKQYIDEREFQQRINSWYGHARNANVSNLLGVYNDLLSI